jgi:Tol biopolymer transport system component
VSTATHVNVSGEETALNPAISRRSILLAGAAATAAAATPLALWSRAAQAAVPGRNGRIAYATADHSIFVVNADGTAAKSLVASSGELLGAPAWSPDGSRLVYQSGQRLHSVRADGTGLVDLSAATGGQPVHPTYTPDGYVIYSLNGQLYIVGAGGNWSSGELLFDTSTGLYDDNPCVSSRGYLIFQRGQLHGQQDIYRYDSSTQATKVIENGSAPDFSPDGTKIAFVRPDSATVHQIWIANADGTGQVPLTATTGTLSYNLDPSWSPDGASITYQYSDGNNVVPDPVKRIDLASKTSVTVVPDGSTPKWQPINRNTVRRLSGRSRIEVAVATSQWSFADHGVPDHLRGQATSVTLARSDVYQNALGGAVLAVNKQGPLLITSLNALDAPVETEINRVLGGSGTVYVLGGLGPAVETRLRTLGYTVDRVRGDSPYGTNVAIADRIVSTPRYIIIANATTFQNSLVSAAAAAARRDTVVMFTDDNKMPAQTAAYLNRFNPDPQVGTVMVCVGGLARDALINAYVGGQMPSWPASIRYYPLVGAGPEQNARLLADFFFTSPWAVAVATTETFYDALGGAAMIGGAGGPLLLTPPGALSTSTANYLSANSGSISEVIVLGAEHVVPRAFVAPIGDAVGLPGEWDYLTSPTATAKRPALAGNAAVRPRTSVAPFAKWPNEPAKRTGAESVARH